MVGVYNDKHQSSLSNYDTIRRYSLKPQRGESRLGALFDPKRLKVKLLLLSYL